MAFECWLFLNMTVRNTQKTNIPNKVPCFSCLHKIPAPSSNIFYFCCFFLLVESFFGDSFCVLNAVQDVSNFQLSLQIKTSRQSGLLLLAAGMEDYLFLELVNGNVQVHLQFNAYSEFVCC